MLIDEIRINPEYAQRLRSDYPVNEEGRVQTKDDSVPQVRSSIKPTGDYLQKVLEQFVNKPEIMPANCRYIERLSTGGNIVVIEEPPAYRTISVEYNMVDEIDRLRKDGRLTEYKIDTTPYIENPPRGYHYKFTLAFPYVIFILAFDEYHGCMRGACYLRTARMTGLGDYLLKPPLMNISSDEYICFGDKGSGSNMTLSRGVEHMISVFWSAEFNPDYTYGYDAYKKVAGVDTYIGWQELTKRDPMFVYNVEWIKARRNIQKTISEMRNACGSSSRMMIDYRTLRTIFNSSRDSGMETAPRKGGRRKYKLYYDVTSGIYLDHKFFLHVGDPIKWGKHIAYIDSLIGFMDSDDIRMIKLILDNGKTFLIKNTSKVKMFMIEAAKTIRFSSSGFLKNGVEIKPNDIVKISLDGKDFFKKVHYIRKAVDGQTEARMGSSFYILENVEGDLFDIGDVKYFGQSLDSNSRYLLSSDSERRPARHGSLATFNGIDIDSRGSVKIELQKETSGRSVTLHADNGVMPERTTQMLFSDDNFIETPPIVALGRCLFNTVDGNGELAEGNIYETPEGYIWNENYNFRPTQFRFIEENLLSEDKSELKVHSFGLDINFKIGEKVVYADWEEPMNMLKPRTITGFVVDTDRLEFKMVLTDKNDESITVPYIAYNRDNKQCMIKTGKIRHITNAFDDVVAGTKIKAKIGYIPQFPKKDTNIIIGFITDTGEDDPLVLCSNCCTIWFSDLKSNFSLIPMKSKRWKNLNHAPIDISKIKPQAGDIFTSNLSFMRSPQGWMAYKTRHNRLRMVGLKNLTGYPDRYSIDKHIENTLTYDCILNPRIRVSQIADMGLNRGWPNLHGTFIKSNMSPYHFVKDERSFIDV
jgi:hypothetical protein